MNILLDVDDCLLDWIGGFKKYVLSKKFSVRSEQPLNWNLEKWVDSSHVDSLVSSFNTSVEFGELEAIPDSIEVIRKLFKKKFSIVAITCCGDSLETNLARQRNLFNRFGPVFTKVHCLGLKESKQPTLEKYDRSWWIEDKPANAVMGSRAGHSAILLDRPHNQGADHIGVTRCHNWSEIAKLILV